MTPEIISSLVRHVLTFGGGYLVTKGYLDDASMQAAIGAVVTLAGVAWSVWAKKKPVA